MSGTLRACTRLVVCGILAFTASPQAAAQEDEWLGSPGSGGAPAGQLPTWLLKQDLDNPPPQPEDPRYAEARAVEADLEALRSTENRRFRLTLLDGSTVVVRREREERRSGGMVWIGGIEGEPGSNVILSLSADSLSGSIRSFGHDTHLIDPAGDGSHHWIREVRIEDLRPDGSAVPPTPGTIAALFSCADPESEVDVMVLYTSASRNVGSTVYAEISEATMEANVYRFVAETNESFVDSDVIVRLRLTHLEEVNGVTSSPDPTVNPIQVLESAVTGTDLLDLQGNDRVKDLRNTYGADIVVLMVRPSDYSGRTTGPEDDVAAASQSEQAYCIVAELAAEEYLTFSHEVGHVFGADHECDASEPALATDGPSHGYDLGTSADGKTRGTTMMSISDADNRKPYWSDPAAELPGHAGVWMGSSGTGCTADNHSVLNDASVYVANYRCSSPGRSDVWMKDTWFDTGDEPYAAVLFEVLWDSPYLWVRRDQDVAKVHQHQHENPVSGTTNWIYVKLQNGSGLTQTGDLELYWADSSTSITWPGGWTLLGTTPASIAPNSSLIAETSWSVPTGLESVCMVARWVSAADPMTRPETASIFSNVSGNNNIIWKNLQIVTLFSTEVFSAHFIVRNPPVPAPAGGALDGISLVIRPPPEEAEKSFISAGQVTAVFDDVLMEAWEESGRSGSGFQDLGEGRFRLASGTQVSRFQFDLPRGDEGRVELIFERTRFTPGRRYVLDVHQRSGFRAVGGMTYHIRCPKPRPLFNPAGFPVTPASGGPGQ